MMIYLLFIIILLGLFYLNKKDIVSSKALLIMTTIMFSALFGLRSYTVGIDTNVYFEEYKNISKMQFGEIFNHRMEIGFVLFIKMLTLINSNPQFMLWATGIIISFSVSYSICRYSKNKYMSFILYIALMFLMSFMNIMRQALSISILLFSIKYIIEDKPFKAVVIILLASTFHVIGIVFIPIVFLRKIEINFKFFLFNLLASFVCFLFFDEIINLFFDIFPKFSHYKESIFGESNYFGALIDYLYFLVIYMFIFFNLKKMKTKLTNVLLWILNFQIFLQLLVIKMTIISRAANVFSLFIILTIPMIYSESSGLKKKIFSTFIYGSSIIYFAVISIYRPEWNGAIPYKFYWQ